MGVLAAILADAGRIALDVAGIERRLVERRREQQRQPIAAMHRAARRARAIACAARAGSAAPEIAAQDCAMESMRHSSLAAEPSGVPSS